jgi:Zn-dependent membrane protease YugP
MSPVLILLPALGLILGPRVWVNRVLVEHDAEDPGLATAHDVARALLDRQGLQAVRVEPTDGGDHYDPRARVVRLSRRNYQRRSLTAVTTAAHEVAHALQHASHYAPFALRTRLARLAQVSGEIGGVMLVSVPLTFFLTRQTLPRAFVGTAALGMLGTSAAAQLAALPTELDASFKRALPMLEDGVIAHEQIEQAHRILYACSMTYVSASLASVLPIWPWVGRASAVLHADGGATVRPALVGPATAATGFPAPSAASAAAPPPRQPGHRPAPRRFEGPLRRIAKPLIRRWLSAVSHTQD